MRGSLKAAVGEDMESVPLNPNRFCWPAGNWKAYKKICSGCAACCAVNVTDAGMFNVAVPCGGVALFPFAHALASAVRAIRPVGLCDLMGFRTCRGAESLRTVRKA